MNILDLLLNNTLFLYSIITKDFVSLSKQILSSLNWPIANSVLTNSKLNKVSTFDSITA